MRIREWNWRKRKFTSNCDWNFIWNEIVRHTHTHNHKTRREYLWIALHVISIQKYSCLLIINYELITCGTFKQRFHLHFTCLQWHANYSIYHFKRVHGAVQIQNAFFFLNSVFHLLWNRLIKSVFLLIHFTTILTACNVWIFATF